MLLSQQEDGMGRRGYPAEFRQRVFDLVAAGRRVADVAGDLGVSEQMRRLQLRAGLTRGSARLSQGDGIR